MKILALQKTMETVISAPQDYYQSRNNPEATEEKIKSEIIHL